MAGEAARSGAASLYPLAESGTAANRAVSRCRGGRSPLRMGQTSDVIPTGDVDAAAQALAERIGGQPSVRIRGHGSREFDAVSDRYVAQTTRSASAASSPRNFLSGVRRAQIRHTLSVARETGREALFEFTGGSPARDVIDFIARNAERVGARFIIVARPEEHDDASRNHRV